MHLLYRVGCRQSLTGTGTLDGAIVASCRTGVFKRRCLSTGSWLRTSGRTSAAAGEASAGVGNMSSLAVASAAGTKAVGSLKIGNRPTFARSFTTRSTEPPPSPTGSNSKNGSNSKWSGGVPALVGAAVLFAGGFFGAQLLAGAGPSSDDVSRGS